MMPAAPSGSVHLPGLHPASWATWIPDSGPQHEQCKRYSWYPCGAGLVARASQVMYTLPPHMAKGVGSTLMAASPAQYGLLQDGEPAVQLPLTQAGQKAGEGYCTVTRDHCHAIHMLFLLRFPTRFFSDCGGRMAFPEFPLSHLTILNATLME